MTEQVHTKLKGLIEQLENELNVVNDPEHQATIEAIKANLQNLKEQTAGDTSLSAIATEKENSPFLEASINFEESHPKIATVLNDIAYLLNNIGI